MFVNESSAILPSAVLISLVVGFDRCRHNVDIALLFVPFELEFKQCVTILTLELDSYVYLWWHVDSDALIVVNSDCLATAQPDCESSKRVAIRRRFCVAHSSYTALQAHT